ncbi:replication protein A 32 kDa subunit [Anthonomus grandis grandis]|uniref:replication protein A 32 kDa subunit n=1 Tax=Anthonomus grandis grandis TaxID=2921223 RepID=UPI002164F7FE|nr:replication protein A 32 kDa subunit [Anthonomus grandis grandis]
MSGYGFGDESMVGGFMNSSNIDNFGTGKKKGVRRLQSVVPIVIRMLRDFYGDEFKLFGLPVQIVSIVGVLQSFDLQSTKATYTIQDHTGTVKAVWWVDKESDDETVLPDVKEGTYVKIFGTIKTADGEKSLLVLKMFPLNDLNVVNTHLLEVINSRLQAEAFSKDSLKNIKQNNPGASLANAMTSMTETAIDHDQQSNMTPIQLKLFKILQADDSQSGPDKATIFSHFPKHQIREVNEALNFLVNEGHAYSTVDNDHFKPTDS